ncbi:MAG: ATP-binding protein [Cyanobium sp.]
MERFVIRNEKDIGIAVVCAQTSARSMGFNQSNIERLGTGISELAHNIVKYAPETGGDIIVTMERQQERLQLMVKARDNGPGIADIDAAMQAHFSTSGSLGLGLPGLKRMMDAFSIISVPGTGTVVTIRMEQ